MGRGQSLLDRITPIGIAVAGFAREMFQNWNLFEVEKPLHFVYNRIAIKCRRKGYCLMLRRIALLSLLLLLPMLLQASPHRVTEEFQILYEGQPLQEISLKSLSADGRFLLIRGRPQAANFTLVIVYDRLTDTSRLVQQLPPSVSDLAIENASISLNGRYVFFDYETDLSSSTRIAIFHDLETNTSQRIGRGSNATQVYADDMTPDGRYLVYSTNATTTFDGITTSCDPRSQPSDQGCVHTILWDRQTGRYERVGINATGQAANNNSFAAQLSDDGRYVAFMSDATNITQPNRNCDLNANETYPCFNFYVRDRLTGQIERANFRPDGSLIRDVVVYWSLFDYSLSGNGRYLLFFDADTDAIGGIIGSRLYLRDLFTDTTEMINRDNNGNMIHPAFHQGQNALSYDGRYVIFVSTQSGQSNEDDLLYLRDRVAGTTTQINLDTISSTVPVYLDRSAPFNITANGREIIFTSKLNGVGLPQDTDEIAISSRPALVNEELLINGSFESNIQRWRGVNLIRDRVVCGEPTLVTQGNCAFQFTADAGVTSKLMQFVNTSAGVPGDTLTLSADVMGRTFTGGRIFATIFYADGTNTVLELDPAAINNGTYAYTPLTNSTVLTGLVSQVRVEIRVRNGTGRLTVDNVQLRLTEGAGFGGGGGAPLIPMP